jgi:hypothetical protein
MGKLTAEQKVREYNRGQKAAREGRSRYWSEPSAYPFESTQHYEARAEAFAEGYDDQFQRNLVEINRNSQPFKHEISSSRQSHRTGKFMSTSTSQYLMNCDDTENCGPK